MSLLHPFLLSSHFSDTTFCLSSSFLPSFTLSSSPDHFFTSVFSIPRLYPSLYECVCSRILLYSSSFFHLFLPFLYPAPLLPSFFLPYLPLIFIPLSFHIYLQVKNEEVKLSITQHQVRAMSGAAKPFLRSLQCLVKPKLLNSDHK